MWIKSLIYEHLDKWIAGRINQKQINHERDEARTYRGIKPIQEMNTEFVALDTKSSALIAHLSLIIAAISVLHSTITIPWLKMVFIVEIIYYICTLTLLLRVVYYQLYGDIVPVDNQVTNEQRSDYSMRELLTRGIYYQRAHLMTNIGTVVLVLSLIVALFEQSRPGLHLDGV